MITIVLTFLLLLHLSHLSYSQLTAPDIKNEDCPHCSHCYHETFMSTPLGEGIFKTLDVSFQEDDPLRNVIDYPLSAPWQCDSCLDNMHRSIQMNLRIPDSRVPPQRLWISNPNGIVTGMSWDSRYDPQPTGYGLNDIQGTDYVHPCTGVDAPFPNSDLCQNMSPEDGSPIYIAGYGLGGVNPSFNIFLTGCDYWPEKDEVTNQRILADYGSDGVWEHVIGTTDRDDCFRSHTSPDCVPPPPPEDLVYSSVAERFISICLHAIRRAIPDPPLHARNLYHLSAAMWDAWVAYDDSYSNTGFLFNDDRIVSATDAEREAFREEAIVYAAYRILAWRYSDQPEAQTDINNAMTELDYPLNSGTAGSTPLAIGNRIAQSIIDYGLQDGSNEQNGYADTTNYAPINDPLYLNASGTVMVDPDRWQPLSFDEFVTQNGIELGAWTQEFQGVNTGYVSTFAMDGATDRTFVELDGVPYPSWFNPGAPPSLSSHSSEGLDNILEVIRLNSLLDFRTAILIDISPAAMHNNTLGANDGAGYAVNPVTGGPYTPQLVNEADYGRVVAEFWADGPESETPPGHWNVIAQEVRHHSAFTSKWQGQGDPLNELEWDIKSSFVLNGAAHDASIAAWSNKRAYDYSRPISQIRYLAGQGLLPLEEGLVEFITSASSAAGERHNHLSSHVGKIAVKSWRPPSANGVEWVLGVDWAPYQRPTFVTPAFAGYVSGHSTYSRAAAEVLADITGSDFFPGGIYEHTVKRGDLAFDYGPLTDVTLSHATYFDAADEAGRSRLWGGIHPSQDDLPGRIIGSAVGKRAVEVAMEKYFASPQSSPPTTSPSKAPTGNPMQSLSSVPTVTPTKAPSSAPIPSPTLAPQLPTNSPSISPTRSPSLTLSKAPSTGPTASPTRSPSSTPSRTPTNTPSLTVCNENGICDFGENCNNCPSDCASKTTGNPNSQYCCNGDVEPDCGDSANCDNCHFPTPTPTCVCSEFTVGTACNDCGGGSFCKWNNGKNQCNPR